MYALVQNGEFVRLGIAPDFCPNGCTVSNPELLPPATLAEFGYLPYTTNIPEYTEAQMPVFDHYEILADSVVGHYTITRRTPTTDEQIATLNTTVDALMSEIIPSLMG
jgi:hypothetical protein